MRKILIPVLKLLIFKSPSFAIFQKNLCRNLMQSLRQLQTTVIQNIFPIKNTSWTNRPTGGTTIAGVRRKIEIFSPSDNSWNLQGNRRLVDPGECNWHARIYLKTLSFISNSALVVPKRGGQVRKIARGGTGDENSIYFTESDDWIKVFRHTGKFAPSEWAPLYYTLHHCSVIRIENLHSHFDCCWFSIYLHAKSIRIYSVCIRNWKMI